jgi:hypothetical protein
MHRLHALHERLSHGVTVAGVKLRKRRVVLRSQGCLQAWRVISKLSVKTRLAIKPSHLRQVLPIKRALIFLLNAAHEVRCKLAAIILQANLST